MKKFNLIFLAFIGGFLFGGSPIKDSAEKFISSQFEDSVTISMHTLSLKKGEKETIQNTVKQKFYRDELYYWSISNVDTTLAYAFMDNVIGKSMPITFLVIVNSEGSILATEVIKYREAYGGEVGNDSWLAQFTHFSDTSIFQLGKNIDGISGATISVHSLSKGIQKVVVLFPFIKDKLN